MSDLVHDHARPQVDNPKVRHEHSDVNLRGILVTAAALVAVAVLIHLVCWWLFDLFGGREARAKQSQFPLAVEERDKLPRQPQLEGIKNREGRADNVRPRDLRAEEQPQLDSRGWVDKEKGIIHIPIDQAMKIMVEKDLFKSRPEGQPGNKDNARRAPGGLER
jgi:hypothetical protein